MPTFVLSFEDRPGNKTEKLYHHEITFHILLGANRETDNKYVKNKIISGSAKCYEEN